VDFQPRDAGFRDVCAGSHGRRNGEDAGTPLSRPSAHNVPYLVPGRNAWDGCLGSATNVDRGVAGPADRRAHDRL